MNFKADVFFIPILIVTGSAILLTVLACFVFGIKMRADLA